MPSVTQRIKEIKQPHGGYVRPRDFRVIELQDGYTLSESENIHPSLVGMAVDYLTRFMSGTSVEAAFSISLLGASVIGEEQEAHNLLEKITGLDELSISSACKLVGYDVCFRGNPQAYKDVDGIVPDSDTIANIRTMVERSLHFINQYGPITKSGFNFEGGYTSTITSGDGDFLTHDTLWDFKVSKKGLLANQTLQLLVYYIMGLHSIHPDFQGIKRLGVFNPRLNRVYLMDVADISQETIETVSADVIGYFGSKSVKNVETYGENKDDILWMADIMRELQCSRYMVMKHYAQHGLPLQKSKNKYYIYSSDLATWVHKQQVQQTVTTLITILLCLGVVAVFCLFYFKII